MHPYQWVWKSSEKVNGEYITFAGDGTLDLYHVSIPSGTTVVFKPYITKRQVTIHLGETDTIKVEGTVGDSITGTWLYDNLTNYSKIKNIKSLLASIPNTSPLPYTLGTSTSGKAVYHDEITVPVVRYETSTIYLGGGAFSDGSTEDITLTGPETDVIDLTPYVAAFNNGKGYVDSGSARYKYAFGGWANNGTIVTKIHYGQDVQAVYNRTGEFVESFVLDAGTGTFSDGTTTKTIEYDAAKKLSEQTGYEQPSHSTMDFVSWKWSDDSSVFDLTAAPETVRTKLFNGSKHLVAFYDDNPVTITGYTGVYDGLAHSITASAKQAGSTLEYADNANGPWSTTLPQLTNVGTMTVYVRATNPSFRTAAVQSGTITITPASATVKADDKKRLTTEADPALTATVTGLVNNEPASKLTYTISRAAGTATGTYIITPSGDAVQGNYNVTYETGTFTITTEVQLTYYLDQEMQAYPIGSLVYKTGAAAPTDHTQTSSLEVNVIGGSAIGTDAVPTVWLVQDNNTSVQVSSDALTFKVVTDATTTPQTTTPYTAAELANLNVSADTTILITYKITFRPADTATTSLASTQLLESTFGLIKGMDLLEANIPELYDTAGTAITPFCYVTSTTDPAVYKYSKSALTNLTIDEDVIYYVKSGTPDTPYVH
jgi:hypothetical protein